MAYGIQVDDTNGKTIFNSNNPVQMVVKKGTAQTVNQPDKPYGSGGGGVSAPIVIPDYCFGSANAVRHGTITNVTTRNYLAAAPSAAQIGSGTLGRMAYYPHSPIEIYGGPPTQVGPGFTEYDSPPAYPPTLSITQLSRYLGPEHIITPYNAGQLSSLVNKRAVWNTYETAYFHYPHVFNVIKNSNGTYNYTYAYTVWKMRAGVSCNSLRTTNNTVIQVQAEQMKELSPEIWVRPQSNNTVPQPWHFGILTSNNWWDSDQMEAYGFGYELFLLNDNRSMGGSYDFDSTTPTDVQGVPPRGSWLYGTSRFNRSFRIFTDQRTTTNWEYKITLPGPDWGMIPSTTSDKYVDSSNKTHGVEAYTTTGQKFHSLSNSAQHIVYSSLARATKVVDKEVKSVPSGTAPDWKTYVLKTASQITTGARYQIETVGNTDWNAMCGTSSTNYYSGSIIKVLNAGSGNGTAYTWGPPSHLSTQNMIWGNSTSGPAAYPYKNYCRMTPTAKGETISTRVYNSASNSGYDAQHFYSYMYRWEGNYKITIAWNMYQFMANQYVNTTKSTPLLYFPSSPSGSNHLGMAGSGIQSTFTRPQLYAIADFGETEPYTWDIP